MAPARTLQYSFAKSTTKFGAIGAAMAVVALGMGTPAYATTVASELPMETTTTTTPTAETLVYSPGRHETMEQTERAGKRGETIPLANGLTLIHTQKGRLPQSDMPILKAEGPEKLREMENNSRYPAAGGTRITDLGDGTTLIAQGAEQPRVMEQSKPTSEEDAGRESALTGYLASSKVGKLTYDVVTANKDEHTYTVAPKETGTSEKEPGANYIYTVAAPSGYKVVADLGAFRQYADASKREGTIFVDRVTGQIGVIPAIGAVEGEKLEIPVTLVHSVYASDIRATGIATFTVAKSTAINEADKDIDGDGLTNAQETTHHTDPRNPDHDGDGVNDGDEVNGNWNPYDEQGKFTDPGSRTKPQTPGFLTDPTIADTDKDETNDGEELNTKVDHTTGKTVPSDTDAGVPTNPNVYHMKRTYEAHYQQQLARPGDKIVVRPTFAKPDIKELPNGVTRDQDAQLGVGDVARIGKTDVPGATFEFQDKTGELTFEVPKTAKRGEVYTLPISLKFPDGTRAQMDGSVKVANMADMFEPAPINVTVLPGKELEVEQAFSTVPGAFLKEPKLAHAILGGSTDADDSQLLPFNFAVKDSGQEQDSWFEVTPFATIDPMSGLLRVNPRYTDEAKDYSRDLIVQYDDGSLDDIRVNIRLASDQASYYDPSYPPVTVTPGEKKSISIGVRAEAEGLKNEFPKGTEFEFELPVGFASIDKTSGQIEFAPEATQALGKFQGIVKVTYPDKTWDKVYVDVEIAKSGLAANPNSEGGPEEAPKKPGIAWTKVLPGIGTSPNDDFDQDGIVNQFDPDADNDGVNNDDEIAIGTSPFDIDSDDNGTNDGEEDKDNDGWSNSTESVVPEVGPDGRVIDKKFQPGLTDGEVIPDKNGLASPGITDKNGNKLTDLLDGIEKKAEPDQPEIDFGEPEYEPELPEYNGPLPGTEIELGDKIDLPNADALSIDFQDTTTFVPEIGIKSTPWINLLGNNGKIELGEKIDLPNADALSIDFQDTTTFVPEFKIESKRPEIKINSAKPEIKIESTKPQNSVPEGKDLENLDRQMLLSEKNFELGEQPQNSAPEGKDLENLDRQMLLSEKNFELGETDAEHKQSTPSPKKLPITGASAAGIGAMAVVLVVAGTVLAKVRRRDG
ncbi:hypothetical protein J2S49_000790 [Arcanobacterium wilhelmae]|uniref:Long Rib domain-containing protein n=1 Tax=Arcanobacterium wilhelmae TaxID=1803177 RepID=A0ABT9NAG3_9ACTO|nr:YPDG domain-containing protein [Arcanobacterium wilhelmae]MDP9800714.1 hypothetical protein [Arcanobacterium wilhelmae]WFN90113.1 Rib/alpha-like domain-containing protein [Arcanobacterium wilhelmae]